MLRGVIFLTVTCKHTTVELTNKCEKFFDSDCLEPCSRLDLFVLRMVSSVGEENFLSFIITVKLSETNPNNTRTHANTQE